MLTFSIKYFKTQYVHANCYVGHCHSLSNSYQLIFSQHTQAGRDQLSASTKFILDRPKNRRYSIVLLY